MIFIGHRQEEIERVRFLKSKVKNVKTLDMGSADGKITRQLIDSNNVTAIDFYPDEIKSNPAKKKVIGDIKKLPFSSNTFDQVILFEVLEHQKTASDRKRILREALRVLKLGGQLVLSTPNKKRLTYYLRSLSGKERTFPYMVGRDVNRKYGDFHYFEYTPDELVRECVSVGFKEAIVYKYYFHIPFIHVFFKFSSRLNPALFAICRK